MSTPQYSANRSIRNQHQQTFLDRRKLSQFFSETIICFDGDESGYKAALRAAENSLKFLQPEKQISFLFLPNKEDPDSFINKNGKEFFLEFSEKNKIEKLNKDK